MIKAVIFDMDGVLINSEPLHFDAIKGVLKKYDIAIDNSALDRFVGDTNERVWSIFKEEYHLQEDTGYYIKQQLEMTIDCLKNGSYQPIDGVIELLQKLKAGGYTVAVASSSPPVVIKTILEVIGIEHYISVWTSGNEVSDSKPAPFIYLRAAEKAGYTPEECVAVEDSYYGVTAAKAAGLKCIGYKAPGAIEQDLSAADIIVENMNNITLQMIVDLAGI